jgi:hypothetical protein
MNKLKQCYKDALEHHAAAGKALESLGIELSAILNIDAPGVDRDMTANERLLMCAINSKKGIFACDLLSPVDIVDGMADLHAASCDDLSPISVGRMMTAIGRYVKSRANDGQHSTRLWIVRNFTDYNHLTGIKLHEAYIRVKRAVPPVPASTVTFI